MKLKDSGAHQVLALKAMTHSVAWLTNAPDDEAAPEHHEAIEVSFC